MAELKSTLTRRRIAMIILGIAAVLGGMAIFSDGDEFLRVLREANWGRIPFAIAFMAISYFLTSYSFARINRLLGVPLNLKSLTQIGFTTTALNHLISTGGIAGYSLRYLLMRGRGVKMKDVFSSSILHFYLTSLVMLGMLPIGMIYLTANSSLQMETSVLLILISILAILLFILATGFVLKASLRKRMRSLLSTFTKSILNKDVDTQLSQIDQSVSLGVDELSQHPFSMTWIMAMIFGDWLASATALWFCFDALGPGVSFLDLIAGFVISIVAGVLSLIPGGIGVQEGSMAGIFSLLGTSFEQAILASVLFRVIYYVLPFIISILSSWRLLQAQDGFENIEVEYAHPDS